MSEQTSETISASRKRSHDEAEGLAATKDSVDAADPTHLPIPTSVPSSPNSLSQPRQQSPAITVESSALSEPNSMTPSAAQSTPAPDTDPAPKRQKMNFAQKELHRAMKLSEKEEKERKKAEEAERKEKERQERDEQKRRKGEEKEAAKRQRDLEKAEKQKVRDAEKQAKEDAKQKKDEEKNKKERSQLRLVSFFGRPAATDASADSSRASSRRASVVSLGGIDDMEEVPSTKVSPQKKTEVKRTFLPFFVPQSVEMAPTNRFARDPNLANMVSSRLDAWMLQQDDISPKNSLSTFKSKKRKRCQRPHHTMRQIVDNLQGTFTSPIDLTESTRIHDPLSAIRTKILSFREDVRPPYIGTYTRPVSPRAALKLSRRPFTRHLPDTNYEYDSEAEWEPPNEDDEDLESGDDVSDPGEEGDEDMDGFLDDEDDGGRRRQIVGDMVPVSSGMCWANSSEYKGSLEEYRIQMLSDEHAFPIDPFSTSYWPKAQQPAPKQTVAMQPPRLPLSNLNPNRSPSMTPPSTKGEGDQKSSISCQTSAPAKATAASASKPLKIAPDDVLPSFKEAVSGSDLTKAGLIEILKKQYV
jgi:chromatin assembly factor 1 subunit A